MVAAIMPSPSVPLGEVGEDTDRCWFPNTFLPHSVIRLADLVLTFLSCCCSLPLPLRIESSLSRRSKSAAGIGEVGLDCGEIAASSKESVFVSEGRW